MSFRTGVALHELNHSYSGLLGSALRRILGTTQLGVAELIDDMPI
jgi:hypothetical protein